MNLVTIEHFKRAIDDVGAHGDNDMLPFDVDTMFLSESKDKLAKLAFDLFDRIEKDGKKNAKNTLNSIQIFSERLLSPTGASGFRISTKIHPFWNIYLNGLAIAIAEKNEPKRSSNAHSYRFVDIGPGLFDRDKSWRAYKEATIKNPALKSDDAVVVQTDISSFMNIFIIIDWRIASMIYLIKIQQFLRKWIDSLANYHRGVRLVYLWADNVQEY